MTGSKLLTLREFSEAVNIPEENVLRLIEAGVAIPHIIQAGGILLFPREEAVPVVERIRAQVETLLPSTARQFKDNIGDSAPRADGQKPAPKKRGPKPKSQGV